ncbi:MAG: hypothetical protein OHK0056_15300 [Bacteriovoracaceae bacterium]
MRKIIFSLFLFISSSNLLAEGKTYTQEEFDKAVKEKVEEQLKKVHKDNLVTFSTELLKREEELKLKEMELKKREEQVGLNNADLTNKIKEFQEKQNKLIGCMDEIDNQKKRRIDHMVDAVSGMRPQNAADVLSVQEAEIAVQILGQLPSDKVSKIFNLMEKEVSARLQKQYLSMKK